MSYDEAVSAVKKNNAMKEDRIQWQDGFMGDGNGSVNTARANYYLVRYPYANSPAVPVYSNAANAAYADGEKVKVGYLPWEPGVFQVITSSDPRFNTNDPTTGTANETPTNPGDSTGYVNLKPHAVNHQYLGTDPVAINWRQITPLGVFPTSPASLFVTVRSGYIPRPGADTFVLTQNVDLSASVPGAGARYALISFDSTGAVTVTDGTPNLGGFGALTAADIPNTPAGDWRSCAVVLYAGQTAIVETRTEIDFYDLRFPEEQSAGTGGAGTPAAPDTSVQFNDGGAFGGDADLTWDKTGNVLGIAGNITFAPSADRYIQMPEQFAEEEVGDLYLVAGKGFLDEGDGGKLWLIGGSGNGTTNGGPLQINGGQSGDTAGNGGELRIEGGTSFALGDGGLIQLTGGQAAVGNGGNMILYAGDSADGNGGDVVIDPGLGGGGGVDGNIRLENPDSGFSAILDIWSLTTANQTYVFPDASGTFVLAPVAPDAYTPSNVTTNRTYDADATDVNELADVLGTLIADLQARGLIG